MADKTAFPNANRTNAFVDFPEAFTLVEDPSHALYDPRVHNPVSNELVENIMVYGIIEPVIVRKNGSDVEVVDGRQRVKAALEANRRYEEQGVDTRIKVPFMQRKDEESRLFGITISANELRMEDKPLVKAEKAQRLLSFGKTEREVAISFGMSLPELKKIIALLDLCPAARRSLEEGELSITAASKLAPLSRTEQKKRLDTMREQGGKITAARVEKETMGGATVPAKKMRCRNEIEKSLAGAFNLASENADYNRGWNAALQWVLCMEGE